MVALYRNLGQNQNIVLKFYFDICIIGLLRSIISKLIFNAEIGIHYCLWNIKIEERWIGSGGSAKDKRERNQNET